MSPVTPMHASQVIRCEHCERDQAFDPAVWTEVMTEARKALGSGTTVQSEVVVPDDLPRKVGVALQVSSVPDEPPQRVEGARQFIPSADTYRGAARVGWFMLAEDAAKDGIAPDKTAIEDAEESARDRFGFKLNGSFLLVESALVLGTVWFWKGLAGLESSFWVVFVLGAFVNGIWGWAGLSLSRRPKETDIWIYYAMAIVPQLIWMALLFWIAR